MIIRLLIVWLAINVIAAIIEFCRWHSELKHMRKRKWYDSYFYTNFTKVVLGIDFMIAVILILTITMMWIVGDI